MNQIVSVIALHWVNAVEKAPEGLPHFPGFMLFPVHGHGVQIQFAGDRWNPGMHDRTALMIFPSNDTVDVAGEAIPLATHTGNASGRLIPVFNVEDIVPIRTHERGDASL